MDKEKAKALSKTLACYKELQENNNVNLIEFHTADGQKHGIGNPEAIKLLLSVAVIELERQLRTAQFGDIPESLENSREYKAAKQLEYAMNDLGFKSERFAQALPYFQKIPVCPLSKCHVHRREDTKPPPCRAGREYLPRHDAHAGPDSGVLGRYP